MQGGPLDLLRYATQKSGVLSQWDFLSNTLARLAPTLNEHAPMDTSLIQPSSYAEKPYDLLRDLSALSHDYLKRPPCLTEEHVQIATAAFDVALHFDRVETAADFLELLPTVDSRRIHEFLHHVRLALQWSGVVADAQRIDRWLNISKLAISNCSDWGNLSADRRFNCHELIMGRTIKLGAALDARHRAVFVRNASGRISDDDLEGLIGREGLSLRIGTGEMTLKDLRKRIALAAKRIQTHVAAISIFVARDFISCNVESATPSGPVLSQFHDYRPMTEIGARLCELKLRENFALSYGDLSDLVEWPPGIVLLLREILDTLHDRAGIYPKHVIATVNGELLALPWQHLFAKCCRFAPDFPVVSLLPNFGVILEAERSKDRRVEIVAEPGLVSLPHYHETIDDPEIRSATDRLRARIQIFERSPPYSLGYLTAHGDDQSERGGSSDADDDDSPKFRFGPNRYVTQDEFHRLLRQEIVYLAVCNAGAPGLTTFGDIGGIIAPYLMSQTGLILAPVTAISALAARALGRRILAAKNRAEVIGAYRGALMHAKAVLPLDRGEVPSDPYRECFLFNMYGLPVADLLEQTTQPQEGADG